MIKKIEILGISLDNYTVREAMFQIEDYWTDTKMSTVEAVSMETLVKAQTDDLLKTCIENLDLAIICDKEILKAAGVTSVQRVKETADNEFFKEFMKFAVHSHKTVYLLGDTSEQTKLFQSFLKEAYAKLKIVGSYALSDCSGDYDAIINEVNIAAPDLILSVLPIPKQEYFLQEHKGKLNAKIWYGVGEHYINRRGVSEVAGFAKKLIQKGILHSMLLRYKNDNGNGEE